MLLAFLANRLLFSIHFDVFYLFISFFALYFCTFIYMGSNIVYLIFLNIIING